MAIAALRDISIIFLAFESIIVLVLLSVLIIQIRNLVILLNEEIRPMLEASQETADTVRNTTTFVSKHVAQPFINISSFAAGLRGAAKTLANGGKPPKSKSTSPKTPQNVPDPVASTPDTPPASPDSLDGGIGQQEAGQ